MTMKSHQLQAAFARRREVENMRVERTAAVNRYYDHWGKITSRFENWTTPEYYEKADEQLKQTKEKKEKAKQLEERRGKLRELYGSETSKFEQEMRARAKPRSRNRPVDTETLAKIEQNARERDNRRRKLDMEAKLYGRWRHGVDDENLIFESKSDHQVLAKLNWLDKQIEDQLEREKEQAISQERSLQLQQEINKTEQTQKERQQIREQELKEIRALQESHMNQLKSRQRESDTLKDQESMIRSQLNDLEKELDLLIESSAAVLEPSHMSQAYNLNKIKVFIRKRSEIFRNQIKLTMDILERIKDNFGSGNTNLQRDVLLDKYQQQYEAEAVTLSQIEAMYESEAKYNLQRCEQLWQSQHLERYHDMQQLLKAEQCSLSARLNDNLQRQTDLIELRSTHLSSIDNSNEKLKQLIKEQEDSPRGALDGESNRSNEEAAAALKPAPSSTVVPSSSFNRSQSSLPKLSDSFTNLNLDVWQDLPSARGGADSKSDLQSQRSMQVVTPDTMERPKFARKRVAWN